MGNLYQNKYRRDTSRLKGWDYRQNAVYFVTICTKGKTYFFGEIELSKIQDSLSNNGELSGMERKLSSQTNMDCKSVAANTQSSQTDMDWKSVAAQSSQTNMDWKSVAAQNFAPLRSYMNPTDVGQIAYDYWLKIPEKYPFINLGEFVIMPNHVHGILIFNQKENLDWQPSRFGPQSQSLGAVIRGYKAAVKTFATKNEITFAWQSRFHDHIIRDQRAFDNISRYISDNPKKWKG